MDLSNYGELLAEMHRVCGAAVVAMARQAAPDCQAAADDLGVCILQAQVNGHTGGYRIQPAISLALHLRGLLAQFYGAELKDG